MKINTKSYVICGQRKKHGKYTKSAHVLGISAAEFLQKLSTFRCKFALQIFFFLPGRHVK